VANDRMFLVNKKTKKYLCLAKNLGNPWSSSGRSQELDEFLDDEENKESFWEDKHNYELLYEDELKSEHINFNHK